MNPPPSPAELVARYGGDVRRRENTITLDSERWTALETNADRWGVGAFCHHDGRVLLVREGTEWLLPGGICEPGETLEEGAVREVREETGVAIDIEDLAAIAEQTFLHEADRTKRFEFRFATFLATTTDPTTSTDPGLSGEEIDDVRWMTEAPENTFERDLVVSISRSVFEQSKRGRVVAERPLRSGTRLRAGDDQHDSDTG